MNMMTAVMPQPPTPSVGDAVAAIPTLSEWGLILLAIFLVSAGMFVLYRRHRPGGQGTLAGE
jgi:hypothetical protein